MSSKRRAVQKRGTKRKDRYALSICRCPGSAPDVMHVKLTYCENRTINALGGGVYVYRGNSINDPDLTGVGHQAMGHDEWATLYRRYKVTGSKITVIGTTTDTGETPIYAVTPMTQSAALGAFESYQEQEYSKMAAVGRIGTGFIPNQTVNFMSTRRMRGIYEVDDEDYAALMGNNPTKEWFWHIAYADTGKSSADVTINISIKLEYWCALYDRQQLEQS